jgi:Undecaprenyl-phosphate glucose phosphotransferase
VGAFDERRTRLPDSFDGHPIRGGLEELEGFIRSELVDDVFIALPWSAEDRLMALTERLRQFPVRVYLASDLVKYRLPLSCMRVFLGLSVLEVLRPPFCGLRGAIKTLEDRVLALILSIILLPVLLAVAIAIKCDSSGPVLFRQKRYGFNNKPIKVLKFRTMFHHMGDPDAERLTAVRDPRVTRVGRFLRRTSLDELPQLINVLRGDMSLVGPRPHAAKAKAAGQLYQEIIRNYAARHRVKPGITGWAQVNGWRGDTDSEDKIVVRFEHDMQYIEEWSFLLDLKILALTLWVPFWQKNAY